MLPPKQLPVDLLRLPLWVVKLNLASRRHCPQERKLCYGPHRRQYVLACSPPRYEKLREAVVVYIHGGGWQFGRPEMFRLHAHLLSSEGYHAYLPSHRRIPRHDFRHIRNDLVAFMATIREDTEKHERSHWPLILGGSSSGGHLSALFTFHPTLWKEAGYAENPVKALFLLGAPLHLERMWPSPPLRCLLGPRGSETFQEANPWHHLTRHYNLPVLIMHGADDGIVEPENALAFAQKLQSSNEGPTELVLLPSGGHMAASSWCFEGHPAHQAFWRWLEKTYSALTRRQASN